MPIHGVELVKGAGGVFVLELPSGITALIGTAPKGASNVPTLVSNQASGAQFGDMVPGFSIPQAIDTHFKEGGQPLVVINVYDPATDTTAVASEVVTMVNGKSKTVDAPISGFILSHSSGTPVYVKDTDYTIDAFGNIVSLDYTKIAAAATVKAVYNKLNAAAVTSSRIVGTIDSGTNARTGMKLLEDAYALTGKEPKVIIAPQFSTVIAVAQEMLYWASRLGAAALIDAPKGTTLAAALASRSPAGAINFNIFNGQVYLCFPWIKSYDPPTDSYIAKPMSQFLSGVIGRVDTENGFHWSPSNKPLYTAVDTDVKITGSAIVSGTDAQALNDLGIITVINEGGLRTWGNRNSLYPSVNAPETFISIQRVADIASRSIQRAMAPYIDRPINKALIDHIKETANAYLRTLITKGAMIDALAFFDPNNNPAEEIAAGHLTFDIEWAPAPPLEHLTVRHTIRIELYQKLAENLAI